jgi:hypothetical protein
MSDMSSSSSSSGGISFSGLLQILFIGLKLTGYINWPWWQVLLPTWIGLGFVTIFLIIFAILAVYSSFFDN